MKLLPFHTYSQANILGVSPGSSGSVHVEKGKGKAPSQGKRKAHDDEELIGRSLTKRNTVIVKKGMPGRSPTKKNMVVDSDDEFEIVEMETDA